MAIATLDEISGQRAVLGMGAGVSGFRELGISAARSGVALREAVELVRRLLTGETVTYAGSTVRFDGGRLDFTPPRADIPVYIASQRSVGCRAAGRVADGAIMQGCVAERLLTFFAGHGGGRRARGRPRSRGHRSRGAHQRVRQRRPRGRAAAHEADHRAQPGRPAPRLLHVHHGGADRAARAGQAAGGAGLHPRPDGAPRRRRPTCRRSSWTR